MRTPPDPTSFKPKDLNELIWLFKRLYGLGEEQFMKPSGFTQ